jgi:tetratricopeptide (TPR) repeat protein
MANSARIDELQRRFAENPRRYFAPLANEYRKNGNLEQAILICQEYLPQQPGHMSGHIVYGQTLYEAGRFAEARAVFETAVALDPENLIALHHLGDIARQLGDIDAARSWYRRVLETDPRNDEIIGLLAQLESASPVAQTATDPSAPAAEAPVSEPDTANVTEYEPTSVPTIPASAGTSEEPLGFEPTSADSSEANAGVADRIETQSSRYEPPPLPATTDDDAFELVPMESSAPQHPTEADLADTEATEAEDWTESADAESTPEDEMSVASVPPAASGAPAADALDAGLFGEDEAIDEDDEVVGVELSVDAPREGAEIEREVDIFETPPHGAETSPYARAEAPAPVGDVEESVEPPVASGFGVETSPIDGGRDGRETPPSPEEAFVTETMADLYLRQGHLESALNIFRRLVALRPGDEHLRDRLRGVEELLFGATVELPAPTAPTPPSVPAAIETEIVEPAAAEQKTAPVVADEPESAIQEVVEPSAAEPESVVPLAESLAESQPTPAESMAISTDAAPAIPAEPKPTIREFLAGILAQQTVRTTSATTESMESPDVQANGAGTTSDVQTPEAPVTEVPEEASTTPLASIFDEASPSDANVTAATVLAEAFSDETASSTPLEGVPAHRAPNELSLDHVFRTPGKGVESGGFSFDRFFSEQSKDKKPAPPPDPQENPTGTLDDIEQFNAWLNGLKKT